MQRALGWLGALAVVIGAAIGLVWEPPGHDAPAHAPDRSELDPPAVGDPERERLDSGIAFFRRRAERNDSWADWEQVAIRLLQRQRLSGDYGDLRDADRALERAFLVAPPGSGPRFLRMQLSFTLHRLDALETDLNDVEGEPLLRPDERLAIRRYRADLAFYRGRYDEALSRYEALVVSDPSAQSSVALAQYHWRTGALEDADRELTEALALAARDERAWVLLVRALFEIDRERWDEADAAIAEGLTLRPGWWQLEEHAAQVLLEQGAIEDAHERYEAIFSRAPSPEILDALAAIARRQGRTSDFDALRTRAEAMHEERIAIFPEAAAGHAIDHFLWLSEDTDRAIELAESNVAARPYGEAQTKLAIAYARAGRLDDALEVVLALEASPWRTAEMHAIAARVHEATGDRDRAREHRVSADALAPGALDRMDAMLAGR